MLRRQGEVDEQGERIMNRRAPAAHQREQRASVPQFFREVRGELRKVAWPSRDEVVNYSIVVIVVVIALTAIIAGLDFLFGEAILKLFER
jgi:preprotein translocase subunit SecE